MKPLGNKRLWIGFVILLALFFIGSFFLQPSKPKEYPAYVSESPSPTGVKAFYTYLHREKDVKRWSRSPDKLVSEEDQLLVMVEPVSMLDEDEKKAYIEFMETGNTILLFSKNPEDLFELDTELVPVSNGEEILNQNKEEFNADFPTYRLLPEVSDKELLYDVDGVIALKRNFGAGELIVATTPNWLQNGMIAKHDHIPLIIQLINEAAVDKILFDEYIHKADEELSIYESYPLWFLLVLLQGGIFTILGLWYRGKRFGPIYTVREDTVRFSDEGIRALAAWYVRGANYHDSLVIQADYVKTLLQDRWHIPYQKEWIDMGDVLKKKWKQEDKQAIQPFLVRLTDVLNKKNISKQEYLLWSKRLDQLRIEVEEY